MTLTISTIVRYISLFIQSSLSCNISSFLGQNISSNEKNIRAPYIFSAILSTVKNCKTSCVMVLSFTDCPIKCLENFPKCNLRTFLGYHNWKDGCWGSFWGRGRRPRPWNDPRLHLFNKVTEENSQIPRGQIFKHWDRKIREGECFFAQMATFWRVLRE